MLYVIRLAVLVCSIAAVLQAAPARAERKVAALLMGAGFDRVDVRSNLGIAAVRGALRDCAGEVAAADVAVLFYAGHGIEVGGTNYLIPVDARWPPTTTLRRWRSTASCRRWSQPNVCGW